MVTRVAHKDLWIIRHGEPDVPMNSWRITRDEFNHYLLAYDQAGLSQAEAERLRLQYQAYPQPDLVLASDLPRALETAKLYARGTPVFTDPVLREVPVELPSQSTWFLNGRWPKRVWWSYLRAAWFRGLQAESPALSRKRARAAVEFIEAHRGQSRQMAVVSHSGFLLIVVNQLHRQHQIAGPFLPSIDFGRPTGYQWLGKLQSQAHD